MPQRNENLRLAAIDPAPRAKPYPARRPVEARRGPSRMPREELEGAVDLAAGAVAAVALVEPLRQGLGLGAGALGQV